MHDDLFAYLPDRVSIYEVSPRDGLQNERVTVELREKVRLIEALVAAGLERIEITSFVSPKWIPQLADADDVAREVLTRQAREAKTPGGVEPRFSALCPNLIGLHRAQAVGLTEVAVFLSASETHNRKNINKTIAETFAEFEEVIPVALASGLRVRAYVSTAWGCPYEGAVAPAAVHAIAMRLHKMGCYQISLGDTLGCGTPRQTAELLRRMLGDLPPAALALHMHDTRGTALANVLVGLELGIRDYDASIGGLGGCPYAPGAAGNVATEDLVYMLHGMGVGTGIDLDKLVEAGRAAESIVGRKLPGKVHQSGLRSLRA